MMRRVLCAPSTGAVPALRLLLWASRHLQPPPGVQAQSQPAAKADEEDDPKRPIRFSSSKATSSSWTVQQSLGGEQQRPWWRVLHFSFALMALVAWCYFRQETSADRWLKQVLGEEELEPAVVPRNLELLPPTRRELNGVLAGTSSKGTGSRP